MGHMDKAIFDQGLVTRVYAGVPKTDFLEQRLKGYWGGGSGRHPQKNNFLSSSGKRVSEGGLFCIHKIAAQPPPQAKGWVPKIPFFNFFLGGVQKGLLIYPLFGSHSSLYHRASDPENQKKKGGSPRWWCILFSSLGKGGAKRTEKQNLATMARWKPFFETLQKLFLRWSAEGDSGHV